MDTTWVRRYRCHCRYIHIFYWHCHQLLKTISDLFIRVLILWYLLSSFLLVVVTNHCPALQKHEMAYRYPYSRRLGSRVLGLCQNRAHRMLVCQTNPKTKKGYWKKQQECEGEYRAWAADAIYMHAFVCLCACIRVCVRVCVRACVRACSCCWLGALSSAWLVPCWCEYFAARSCSS